MAFYVFTRRWYKPNKAWPNGLEPDGTGRRHVIRRNVATEEEARRLCHDWFVSTYGTEEEYQRTMKRHLGRKAEYTVQPNGRNSR